MHYLCTIPTLGVNVSSYEYWSTPYLAGNMHYLCTIPTLGVNVVCR